MRRRSRLVRSRLTALAAAVLACGAIHDAAAQTARSTLYTGNGGVRYPADARFNAQVAMTVEAWAFRQDENRCETIITQDSGSFSLGFCFSEGMTRLKFSRSGSVFAYGSANVRANLWTHVAVSYDGAQVRFYVDGAPAGVAQMTNPVGQNAPLTIGGGSEGYFLGRLDEVRVWSVARTQAQIQSGMNKELRNAPGLVAVFDTGGPREVIGNVTGTPGMGVSNVDSAFGILPRELSIPRAAITPAIDGRIFTSTEYAGAEQAVVRFREPTMPAADFDFRAYFVRDNDFLYAAMDVSAIPSAAFVENSAVGLFIDPNNSRDALAQPSDMLISSFTNILGGSFRVGDGNGNWVAPSGGPPPSEQWMTASTNCTGFEIGFGTCHEFRISKSLFGQFSQLDGLAIGIIDFGAGVGSHLGPAGAIRTSPATWAAAVYGDGSASLPRVRVSGHVLGYTFPSVGEPLRDAVDVTAPLANIPVTFAANDGSILQTVNSDENGAFVFDVRMPANVPLSLGVFPSCLSCRMRVDPLITFPPGPSVAPDVIRPERVGFPGQPANSEQRLVDVDFRVLQPAGPIQVGEVPDGPSISVKLRTDTPDVVDGDTVRIFGRNLHDDLEIYLSPFDTSSIEESWFLYPAEIVAHSSDGSFVDVKMPVVPRFTPVRQTLEIPPQPIGSLPTFEINWRWVILDRWPRPGYRVYTTSRNFGVEPPKDYPKVFGFDFRNGGSGSSLDDFTAVYGYNAYICIDPFGDCDAHLPDPIYMGLWFPVYKLWLSALPGSCNGFAALSLMFRRGFERTTDYDPNVLYPAGFTTDYVPVWREAGFTHPAEPRNLFARIRQLHGVQTSDEWTSEFLRDADIAAAWPPMEGDPLARLGEVARLPADQLLGMMDRSGHVVTPYRVEGDTIKIYDSNAPGSIVADVVVDRSANTYNYENGNRSGNRMFTMPLSVYRNERTMPGIEDIVDYLWFFVVGDANVMYSTPDGRRWGRDVDGNPVAENPAAVALLPQGQTAGEEPRNFPWLMRKGAADPQIEIKPDGGPVLLHAAGGGTVLQLTVPSSNAGATDQAAIARDESGRARTLRYAPQNDVGVVPKIGMATGQRERVVLTYSGMTLPKGGGQFEARPEARGAQFKNDSGAPITYTLVVQTVDGNSGNYGTNIFGPFEVPANSVQRVEIADWPVVTHVRSLLDIGADGIDDAIALVDGIRCDTGEDLLPVDQDGDGVPDACASSVPNTAVAHVRILPRADEPNPIGGCGLTALGLTGLALAGLRLTRPGPRRAGASISGPSHDHG